MAFVEHDYMVEQIPAATTDEALGHAIGKKRAMQTVVMVGYKFSPSPILSIH
jgi:hypothetical protein